MAPAGSQPARSLSTCSTQSISIFFSFSHSTIHLDPTSSYPFPPLLRAFPGPAHPSSLLLFFLPSVSSCLPAAPSSARTACDFQEASFSVIVFCCRAGLVSQEGSCLTSALPATSVCFARIFLGKKRKEAESSTTTLSHRNLLFSGVFLLRAQIKLFETEPVRPS